MGYASGSSELFALLGNGDGTFKAPSLDAFVSGSRAFAIADINHDGKPDVLVAKTDGTVEILEGNGDGTFGVRPLCLLSSGALAIAVGDLNGDGRPDIVTGNFHNNLSLAFGNGDGTFQTYVSYGPAAGIGSVTFSDDSSTGIIALGDLNGDGKSDIAVVGQQAVTILLNNGDGTFSTNGGTVYDVGDVPLGLALADVNGDGKLDLVVKTNQQSVSVLLNNGDGTFQQTASYSTAPSHDSGANITVVDMNGDGKPDILLGNENEDFSSGAEVVLYNGPPNFSGPVYTIGRTTTSPPDLVDASDTGRSNTDNETANTTPTFTGTADPGATVVLHDSDGATVIGTGVADNTTGAWSITTTGPLSEGVHTITAQATGSSGVAGVASTGLVVTIDTTPPGSSTPASIQRRTPVRQTRTV